MISRWQQDWEPHGRGFFRTWEILNLDHVAYQDGPYSHFVGISLGISPVISLTGYRIKYVCYQEQGESTVSVAENYAWIAFLGPKSQRDSKRLHC